MGQPSRLMRVEGIGGESSGIVETAGVDTVKAFKTRNADPLAAKIAAANAKKKLVLAFPGPSLVARWIDIAKTLAPRLTS